MLSLLGWSCWGWQAIEEAQMQYTMRILLSDKSISALQHRMSWLWCSCSKSAAQLTTTRTVAARRLASTLTLPCYRKQLSPSVRPLMSWHEEIVLIKEGFEVLSVLPRPTVVLNNWINCVDNFDVDIWDFLSKDSVPLLLEALEDDAAEVLRYLDRIPSSKRVHLDNLTTRIAWNSGPPFGILLACPVINLATLFEAFINEYLVTGDPLRLDQLLIVRVEGRPKALIRCDSSTDFPISSPVLPRATSPVVTSTLHIPSYKRIAKKLSLTLETFEPAGDGGSLSSSPNSGDVTPSFGVDLSHTRSYSNAFQLRPTKSRGGLNILLLTDGDLSTMTILRTLIGGSSYAVNFLQQNEVMAGFWKRECVLLVVVEVDSHSELSQVIDYLLHNGQILMDSQSRELLRDYLRKHETELLFHQQGVFRTVEHPQSGGLLVSMDSLTESSEDLCSALTMLGMTTQTVELETPATTSWNLTSADTATFQKFVNRYAASNTSGFNLASMKFSRSTSQDSSNVRLIPPLETAPTTGFAPKEFFAVLKTAVLGRNVMYTEVCESNFTTMHSFVGQLGTDSGLVAVAAEQLSGRGRGHNVWLSPRGALLATAHVSVPLATPLGQRPSLLQHLVAAAVVLAVEAKAPGVGAKVKWPNDVVVPGVGKLGGLLVQSSVMGEHLQALVGVGLNVGNRVPGAASLQAHSVSVEHLLAEVLLQLEQLLRAAEGSEQGLEQARQTYLRHWAHSGQQVRVQEEPGSGSFRVRGIDEWGFLLVEEEGSGRRLSLHPDGNSFDMLQGLLVPKN